MQYKVLRTIYENIGYYPIDDALYRVTESEAESFGFNSRKELIKSELNSFLNDRSRIKLFTQDLLHDIYFCSDDLPELREAYKATVNYLLKLI